MDVDALRRAATTTDPSCPSSNGTVYTSPKGGRYSIDCSQDFHGYDLPATASNSLAECISTCDGYRQSYTVADGANCVAVVFNALNENGDKCYLKYKIQNATSPTNGIFAARRVEYEIGADPVYSAFASQATQSVSVTPTSGSETATASPSSSSSSSSPSSSPSPSSYPPSTLSTGAIAGIAVGAVIIAVAALTILFTFFRQRRRRQQQRRRDQGLDGGGSRGAELASPPDPAVAAVAAALEKDSAAKDSWRELSGDKGMIRELQG